MSLNARIENAIDAALARATRAKPPATLAAALHHAVKPGGARIRPTIALSVSMACGDDAPALADAAASAIELIHCASLVHDDMPCFDDADIRRGKPTVHLTYDEPIALLTGDSLIVLGFDVLADAGVSNPARALRLTSELARYTGMPHGICAGQGWESEAEIDLATYHRAKTGALFTAATRMGAVAAGQDPDQWTELGAMIGEAFQVADDLLDVLKPSDETGKPMGQDLAHNRPSAVTKYGVDGAISLLEDTLSGAISSIPACPGEAALADMVHRTAKKLVPSRRTSTAAE